MRALCISFIGLVVFTFSNAVSAQDSKLFRDAKLEAVNTATGSATFVIEPKGRSRNAKPVKHEAVIREEDMRREPDSGRKVRATLADLRAGQRVRLTIIFSNGITSPNWATDLVILNAKAK